MIIPRKVILYIATSLDGYIAKPNDDLSFLSLVEEEGQDYGYTAFVNSIDTVLMGRKTYDWVMKHVPVFPHADKETYILTRTARPDDGKTKFYTGSMKALVQQLKATEGKDIFVDGGAETVNELLGESLIDEFVISVIPIVLGDGVRLFKDGNPTQNLRLVSAQTFPKGLVQLHYTRTTD